VREQDCTDEKLRVTGNDLVPVTSALTVNDIDGSRVADARARLQDPLCVRSPVALDDRLWGSESLRVGVGGRLPDAVFGNVRLGDQL
jgi:hypothetical protein